jgi:hypothetical protein
VAGPIAIGVAPDAVHRRERPARAILGRYPNCGAPDAAAPAGTEAPADPPATVTCETAAADLADAAADAGGLQRQMAELLLAPPGAEQPADDSAPGLAERLGLSPEVRLLLTLEFRYGLTVSTAARRLGLGTHQAQGLRRRALQRIRVAMQEARTAPAAEDLP